jgi:hypothetical protein
MQRAMAVAAADRQQTGGMMRTEVVMITDSAAGLQQIGIGGVDVTFFVAVLCIYLRPQHIIKSGAYADIYLSTVAQAA